MASLLSKRVKTLEKARGDPEKTIAFFGCKLTITRFREILAGLPQRSIGPKLNQSGGRKCQ